jgi:hypothetical protein
MLIKMKTLKLLMVTSSDTARNQSFEFQSGSRFNLHDSHQPLNGDGYCNEFRGGTLKKV